MLRRHLAIPVGISDAARRADASALGAMPVDQNADIQLRLRAFRRIERIHYRAAGIVVFHVERDNADTVLCRRDLFQQRATEVGWRVERCHVRRGL